MMARKLFGNKASSNWRFALTATALSAACVPLSARARSLLYYYDFDKVVNNALVYTGVNKGTGTVEPTFKQNGSATLGYTTGALGSDHAFCTSNKSAIWIGGDSTSLGCGTTRGFTISFWCKLSSSHDAWSDFFGFRVGGKCYRFEYIAQDATTFTLYGTPGAFRNLETGEAYYHSGEPANTWQHFAIVATPNGTNALGTCAFFIDGKKISDVVLEAAGDLQQLNIGSWVREGNGKDRNKLNANSTGIDELAVFDYPATVEQLKWLAKFKPGQPVAGSGREMPYCWHFDTTNKTFGATAKVNSGTGTKVAFLWGDEKETNPGVNTTGYITAPSTNAALGTAYAMNAGNRATWYVGDSAAGLGPTVGSGFTFSFWMRGNAKPTAWTDFFTFGVGGRYVRYEFGDANPAGIYLYGTTPSLGSYGRKIDTWQHYCAVWNDAEQKIDFYMDGELKGSAVYGSTQDASHVITSMLAGRQSKDGSGVWRLIGGAGNVNPNVFVDEVAMFNYSLSPEQIKWLTNNVPCLPPLDATNLVRTVAASGAWAGGRASWGVREWDDAEGAWANTTRTTIYPALEDTEVEVAVTIADGVTITNDTFVTPKKLAFTAATSAALPVSATLKSAEGSMFSPQTLEIADGLQLTVPLYAVNVGGALTLGAGSKIVFDTANYGDVGGHAGRVTLPVTNAMSVGAFVLPEGESDVLSHFDVTDSRFTLSLSADGKTILVAADTIPVTATWTGAGDGTSLGSAANWDCRNAAGAKVDDALPCAMTRVVVSSGTAAMNAPVGTTLPWQYLSIEAGDVTLAADADWRGLPALAVPEGATINLGGNKLYLNETVIGRGTFTDTAATGGELHFDIAEGELFTNEQPTSHAVSAFALTGTLKLVKDGVGMFRAARTGQTYSGGTDVVTGTLKFGNQPYAGIFGARTGDVTVSKNGTLDMNGWIASYEYQFILNGGTLQNSGADKDVGNSQFAKIRLGADSTLLPTSSMGIVGNGYAATTLDLNYHTLTIPIGGGKALYLANTEIKNGLVDITSGGWLYSGRYTPSGTSNNDIIATNADFRVNAAMRLYAKVRARNYEAIYAYNYNDCPAVIEVNGAFKPSAHNYFRGCTMMDGSTIDFSSRTNALPLVSAFTSGANTLAFETNKTVYVKFGGYRTTSREPIISWAAKPADIDTVKFKSAPGERSCSFIKKDDGLYITHGFMILVR